ncbi:hypothetical protein FQN55_002942 [Onygenales sp. PD_40]|nr:hypothetical protein FQN55_002942 [Onygenales sp. PD_40]KAK2775470.1 hypothetical protein FQN53_003132 [Emmonsiellopsis sp. PD_33]KAK2787525.1 hypothetical protein FQN51_003121 [Onygenales sp. PD_10]
MPRAEVGSTKYLSNKLKSKGLQRLRWYCQVCERQMRDENGFKCHTQSESHVRQMLLVGEDPRKYINQYSNDFISDFLKLLRTAHGEKQVNINHFYQEYIANKEHVHMNATKWPSLTEFAKHLGREGICRVEETEKGIFVSWIDNSPEALRRQDAIRKKERQDRGDEERERKMIEDQVRRAQRDREAIGKGVAGTEEDEAAAKELQRVEGEKIKLNFGPSKTATSAAGNSKSASPALTPVADSRQPTLSPQPQDSSSESTTPAPTTPASSTVTAAPAPAPAPTATTKQPLKLGLSASSKPKNVFAAASKKNALSGSTKKKIEAPPKPLSAAERIMKEEMERKRVRGERSQGYNPGLNVKRQKIS